MMPGMKRFLLTATSFISLLILVAAATVWVWNINRTAYLSYYGRSCKLTLASGGGLMYLDFAPDSSLLNENKGWEAQASQDPMSVWNRITPGPAFWGFGLYLQTTIGRPAGNWSIGGRPLCQIFVPCWFVVLLSAMYPTITFIRGPYRRYRRRKKGLCLACGYNLTGNVTGICSECGEKI